MFLIFTNVNNIRFNFGNPDKPCRKKAKLSEKAFNSYVSEGLKSVGWTIDKFWLNNSLAINGTILRFDISKNRRSKTYVFKFLGFLLYLPPNNSCLNLDVVRTG